MVTALVVAGGLLIGALAVVIGLTHRFVWQTYEYLEELDGEIDWED